MLEFCLFSLVDILCMLVNWFADSFSICLSRQTRESILACYERRPQEDHSASAQPVQHLIPKTSKVCPESSSSRAKIDTMDVPVRNSGKRNL